MVSFDKNDKKSSIKINIIEYECYGSDKSTSTKRFDYLNSHIIPQLIKFVSIFSVVTDNQIGEDIKNSWIDKIISYCDPNPLLEQRIHEWLKQLNSNMRESQIFDKFRTELQKAFRNNIRIMLVIDELTGEQRETIKIIINLFKLNYKSNLYYIDFSDYVVQLESLLSYDDNSTSSKYALPIQDN